MNLAQLLRVLVYPNSLRAVLFRRLIRLCSLFSYRDRLFANLVERPYYGHCIYEAAQLASRLNYPRMSVIEFGCGGGNGLLNAEMHIAEVAKIFPVEIELYGFDTGAGLPEGKDYRDLLHYFKPAQFKMDATKLKERLKIGRLVLGEVGETCKTFFSDYDAAPVGCIFHDLDFYSSTRNALTLFDRDAVHFLPRVFMYFDDIIGNNTWLANEFVGEELAINEFNKQHSSKKIVANRYMPQRYPGQGWVHQIYNYHDFEHPDYNVFVAESDAHEEDIRLR
jgi:hypothetical protein